MKINEIEVNKKDFEGLLKSVKYCIKFIDDNKPERARWTLEVLESHLEHNLLADNLADDTEKNKDIA